MLQDHTGATPAEKTINRLSTIGGVVPELHADWAQTAVNRYATPAAASIYTGASRANICKRYVNGTLTSTNLFPWPMDSRIVAAAARASSSRNLSQLLGSGATNVTDLFTDHFGAIPVGCGGVSTATIRWAVPTGGATSGACTAATPCTPTQAINAAQPGEEVVLKDGTYQSTLITVRGGTSTQRITIRAENRHQAIVKPPVGWDPGDPEVENDWGDIRYVRVDHPYVTISGFTLDGNNYGSFGIVTFNNNGDNGILEHSILKSSNSSLLHIGPSADNVIIRHNVMDDCRQEGFYIGSSDTDPPVTITSTGGQIYGNTMSRVGMLDGWGTFLDIKASTSNMDVHHNIFENAREGPFDGCLFIGSIGGLNNAFHNNIVRDASCGLRIVHVGRWVGHDVHHNVFYDISANATYATHLGEFTSADPYGPSKIRDNTFCDVSPSAPVSMDGVTVSNNAFNVAQSTCNAEVTRILQERTQLPGL